MKIFIIILFFIIAFLLSITMQIDIKKIEIYNKKIKFNIYIKIYLLKKILLYKKKIRKKNIIKLIRLSKKRKIIREEKRILNSIPLEVEKIKIEIKYNLKNPIHSAYLYGTLQAITNIGVSIANPNKRQIIIKNQNKEKTYIYISMKIKVNFVKTILEIIKSLVRRNYYNEKVKR